MRNSDSDTGGGAIFTGKLWLNSLENTRKTYARILRKYAAGELNRVVFRDLVYGLTGYLAYFRTEIELHELRELEERLSEVERSQKEN